VTGSIWILVILLLNGGVSWWNCYVCGSNWVEARAVGGFVFVITWCGAVQAAIGFSMVAIFLEVQVGAATGYLDTAAANALTSLWYIAIIVPALGTGLAISVHSWIVFYRTRSIASLGISAYNTLAEAHNVFRAINTLPAAFGNVLKGVLTGRGDAKGRVIVVVILLAVVALLAGVLLTAVLIQKYAGMRPLPQLSRSL